MGYQSCSGGVSEMRQSEGDRTVVLRHKCGAKDAEIYFFDENGKEVARVEIPAPSCFKMDSCGNGRMKICGKTYDLATGKRVRTAMDVFKVIVKYFFLLWFTLAGVAAFLRFLGGILSK